MAVPRHRWKVNSPSPWVAGAAGGVPVGVPGGGAPGKLPDIDTNVVLVVVTSASDALREKDAPACGLNWTATVQLPTLG